MNSTDPIADMLTRMRNGYHAEAEIVEMEHSRIKVEISRILKKEGFIKDYVVEGGSKRKVLRLYLKYSEDNEPVIRGIRRQSKSGLRVYAAADKMPKVLGGMGVAIVTTPLGLMTGKEAAKRGVGGEVICTVW